MDYYGKAAQCNGTGTNMMYEIPKKQIDDCLYVKEEADQTSAYYSINQQSCLEIEQSENTGLATSGTTNDLGSYIYNLPDNYNILRNADFGIPNPDNSHTIKYVKILSTAFQDVLLRNRTNIKNAANLPPLNYRWLEDNSALIEWIFKDFRIGFSIEPKIEESGWYLVTNSNLEEISASGLLDFLNLEQLLLNLLNFALANS